MKRLGQKICVAAVLSLAFVAIWHDSAKAAMPVISSIGQIKDDTVVNPSRIDVDAAGTIYLCDSNVNGVTRYDKYGQVLPTLKGDYRVKASGVAVTPDGSRVFVSVAEPGKVTATAVAVIDGSTGVLLGYLGVGFNEFKQVVEIDLDGKGNIYVGNYDRTKTPSNLNTTAEVDVYDGSTYAKLYSFGTPATSLVGGYYYPLPGQFGEIAGLTVDVAREEILVAEAWNNNGIARVQIFGLDGTFKRNIPEATFSGTQLNCKPAGLSVDPSGRVYLLSILTSSIHVFTAHPEAYLGKFTKTTPNPAFDATGKIFPWVAGMIPCPSFDTVFDPLTGRLFVVTDGNGIQIFSVDGSTNPVKSNRAPETPATIGPIQGVEVATLTPTLQWAAPLDVDGDVLTYNVEIVTANGTLVSRMTNVATTNLSVSAGTLFDNAQYGWQVQAADAELTSSYSGVESFWINAVEEAPTAPRLVGPAPAATVNKETVFSWQAASDADPFDSVTYRLEIAGSTDFAAPVMNIKQNGLTSEALSTLPGYASLRAGETYLWRVVAVDGTGLTTASEYRSFDCNSAPETPVMLSPIQGGEVATLTPTLQWAAAIDADGDVLSYSVQIVDADGQTLSAQNNVAATSLSVAGGTFLENRKYGWQVQAADAELTSAYSAVESFWVNTAAEAPTTPLLAGPAAAVTADKDTVFSWQAATDADPMASVTYRLEMAKSVDEFATPVIAVEQSELVSAPLSTLPGYTDLQPGVTYQWRVVAVDDTGLTTASEVRSFDYVSTILTVDATFPDAKVYLGGNSAYSGRFVGTVPVELRDINPGTIEVVVERPGFEPWVQSVVVNAWQSVSVKAALVVAILPGDFKLAPFLAGGLKIQGGADASPVLVDFDSDGIDDLLVADGSGKLLFYRGVAGAEWPVATGVPLTGVTLPVGAVPFVADWNNDDRKDLLAGAADGSVSLYLNAGTQALPVFAAAVQLQADNAPLNVVNNAAPLLFDLNNDGAKDLLVGSGNGSVYKFLNIGTDAAPLFAGRELLIAPTAGVTNASPVVADWNADGSKEILLVANQEVSLYNRQADGSYTKGTPLVVHQSLYNSKTRKEEISLAKLGEKVRLIAVNTDGIRGKDLLLGNAAGEILLVKSSTNKANDISPLFDSALLETVAKIEGLIQAHGLSTTVLTSTLSQLKANIESQAVNKLHFYDKAKENLLVLENALSVDGEISALLTRLQAQLNSEIPLN